tara:strand:- start:802 stop:1038 length:237 start_codon:yes stop_codon:yes gene_type:complete
MDYTQNGATKTKWLRHGVMFMNRSGKGFNLILESLPTARDDEGKMKLMAFPPSDRDNNSYQNNPTGTEAGKLDDDIPF